MFFHPILVIYNQQLGLSVNIDSLIVEFDKSNIIIVDNSTKNEVTSVNKVYCESKGLKYICMNGNVGLPKAYNAAVATITKSKDDYILLLDQDTVISADMIKLYSSAIENHPDKMIFCPVVKDSVGIMSPALKSGKGYTHSVKTDFNGCIEKYSFINSGMCINAQVFESVSYDEDLFLDMVDYDFVETVRSIFGSVFYVISDLALEQNFSGVTRNSFSSDYARFSILIKDQNHFYGKVYGNTRYSRRKLFLRAIKLCLIHKNIAFLGLLNKRRRG